MKTITFVLLLLIIVTGCKKSTSENVTTTKSKTDLLIQKPWKLVSYGRDANNNNLVDPSEESILHCEMDNTFSFTRDGSGVAAENTEICLGRNALNTFQWTFINNETGLDFIAGIVQLRQLTEDSMVLSEINTGPGLLLFVYSH